AREKKRGRERETEAETLQHSRSTVAGQAPPHSEQDLAAHGSDMARSQLDFLESERIPRNEAGGFVSKAGGAAPSSLATPMDTEQGCVTTSRHQSIAFGAGGEKRTGEPIALVLMRGRPTSAGRPTALSGLQDAHVPFREQGLGSHSHNHPQGGQWNTEIAAPGGFGEINVGSAQSGNLPAGEDAAGGSWNNSMSQHRRCNSAPNIMEGITAGARGSSNWRNAGLPCMSSVVPAPGLRDHAIPEGRRFEALEPPLQPSTRPRSWRARATPRWGTGPASTVDFGTRDPRSLRASYFVNVRGQGEAPQKGPSVAGLISQSTTIGGMATADTRPFEEIKRMRLSQALDGGGGNGGAHQHDGLKMLGLTPSPTFATSGRAPHFDTARLTPRFSPGKGVKVAGFPSSLNCRPSAFGGAAGLALGPLSPSLTEPPTPPSHWQTQEPEAFAAKAGDGGGGFVQGGRTSGESEQGVLPMAQRPMDEVNAVQALMSVGLGTRAPLEVVPAAAVVVPEQVGVAPGPSAAGPAVVEASEAARSPVPSLERLKPFEGGIDDDDDGLDKDLWVVVEKGSLCASSDCVYRDSEARIASRRHYHSKCTHTHNGGEKKGMVFHHHQLEKVQKHQRSHKREATKSAPYKRTTPEDHQAMEGAGVEGYRPGDWNPEETRQLDELVKQLVAPVTHAWPSIARFFPTKTSIQCLLHWRFTLNDNGIIRGNGTWGAEEDERLRKLAPVFSSPSTGPRWAKIAEVMPGRTAKQCRERYNNHVDPAIKKDKIWSAEEDALVMQLHAQHHNQFAKIARSIPGRCYDDVKNRRVPRGVRFNLLVKRRQLAGKSGASGLSNTGNKPPSRLAVEPSGTAEPTSPATFDGAASAGPFPSSFPTEQSLLTPKGGIKRSTPEASGR
ncbi:unnamed protein product, partial [Scytosiphon promiscuus]